MTAVNPDVLAPAPTGPAPLDDTTAAEPFPRTFAGFALRDLLIMAAGLTFTLWAIWATTALVELRQRRIVSVSLSTIIKDFVSAQARSAATPEIAAARTKAYLGAVDAAMQSMSRDGTTVLVSEAVVGNSVPDMTGAVSAAVNDWLAKSPVAAIAAPAPGSVSIPSPVPTSPMQGAAPSGNPFADAGNGN